MIRHAKNTPKPDNFDSIPPLERVPLQADLHIVRMEEQAAANAADDPAELHAAESVSRQNTPAAANTANAAGNWTTAVDAAYLKDSRDIPEETGDGIRDADPDDVWGTPDDPATAENYDDVELADPDDLWGTPDDPATAENYDDVELADPDDLRGTPDDPATAENYNDEEFSGSDNLRSTSTGADNSRRSHDAADNLWRTPDDPVIFARRSERLQKSKSSSHARKSRSSRSGQESTGKSVHRTSPKVSRSSRSGQESAGKSVHRTASKASRSLRSGQESAGKSNHRPLSPEASRQSTDRRISWIMSLAFFGFGLLITLLLLILPHSTVSEIEKRTLTQFPTLTAENYFSGAFTSGVTQFYNDTVPDRDTFKNIGNNIKSAFGFSSLNQVEFVGNVRKADNSGTGTDRSVPASDGQNTGAEPSTNPDGTSVDPVETANDSLAETVTNPDGTPASSDADPNKAAADETSNPDETTIDASNTTETINSKNYHVVNENAIEDNGFLIVYQDNHWRAFPLYGGTFDSLYSDTVNYVRQVVPEDTRVYFMPCPLAAQFYLPSNYKDYFVDEQDVYEDGEAHMMEGVTSINIIPALDAHNEEDIYLRTDHHWAPLGGYYAAKAFTEAAGVPFADLSTYTQYTMEGYVGSAYTYTESANILNDPEDFVYYVPTNSYSVDYYDEEFNYIYTGGLFFDQPVSNAYCVFLGSDDIIAKITTDVNNGRRLLVIKDSYGNAEVPFLTSSFQEIYVIDQRYFHVNLINFIYYNAITDILFTHNYFDLGGPEAELMEYITYNYTDAPVYDAAPAAVLPDRGNRQSQEEPDL